MKKTILLAAALVLAQCLSAQTNNPVPYCTAGYDDAGGTFPLPHFISSVTLGSLNNTSGNTQYPAPHYVYYSNIAVPNLTIGSTYNLSVTFDPYPTTVQYVAAFIDYNHDNTFDDPGERVLNKTTMASTITYPSVAAVTIPPTAIPGVTRMRVMVIEDDNYSANNPDAPPCTADATGYLDWGETEDYNVNIVSSTAVAGIVKSEHSFLYPNPATGMVHIDGGFSGAEISVADFQGKIALRGKICDDSFDISRLQPGTYIVKILYKDEVKTQMLVVEK